MKIFHVGQQELQLLRRTENNQVEFQNKTFVRDVDVSQRAYARVTNVLEKQGDDTTTCLIVEMDEGYYAIWHEVETSQVSISEQPQSTLHQESSSQLPLLSRGVSRGEVQPTHATATLSQTAPNQNLMGELFPQVSDQERMTKAVAKVVQEVVEQALAHNTHVVPEHLVAALKAEIAILRHEIPITLEDLVTALKTELPSPKLALQLAQQVFSID